MASGYPDYSKGVHLKPKSFSTMWSFTDTQTGGATYTYKIEFSEECIIDMINTTGAYSDGTDYVKIELYDGNDTLIRQFYLKYVPQGYVYYGNGEVPQTISTYPMMNFEFLIPDGYYIKISWVASDPPGPGNNALTCEFLFRHSSQTLTITKT